MTPLKSTVLSIVAGIFLLVISMIASVIAKFYGISLNEGSMEKSDRLSKRTSGILYRMSVLPGWECSQLVSCFLDLFSTLYGYYFYKFMK